MNPESLMRALADGRCHSGEALAERFGVTRAAVWKQVGKLEQWGLGVEAVPGLGYRLDRALDLLDADAVLAALSPRTSARIARFDVLTDVDSTNARLLDAALPEPGAMTACIAEHQRAGRGRRGRSWSAPLAAGLCLSAGWQFAETPPELSALTLAIGVAARGVLERLCGVTVELKWPNDHVWDDRKLGGILVELVAEAQGACHAVAGVGINVAMPAALLAGISDWPRGATDLHEATGGTPPRRAVLAAALLDALADLFAEYAASGFAPYRQRFAQADHLYGRPIAVDDAAGRLTGLARGIDADGALLVETADGARRRVISGDVTIRALP